MIDAATGTDGSCVSADTTDYERACGREDESPAASGDSLRREATGEAVETQEASVWARRLRQLIDGRGP